MSQQLHKVRRIADWLAGAADSLTPAEIRMVAGHLRDVADGKPFNMASVAALQGTFRRLGNAGDRQVDPTSEGGLLEV